jgi:hypothetical protein
MPKSFKQSRRAFLGTAGTLLALPWLDILGDSREARAGTPAHPVRFITFYIPIGVCREGWTPSGSETSWSLGSTIDPNDPELYGMSALKPYQQDINVLTGVSNSQRDGHVAGQACVLTGNQINPGSTGQDTSADQYIADYWEQQPNKPNLRSLELGTNVLTNYPDGYNPIMTDHINWSHGTPIAKEVNPLNAFNRVFAGIDPNATAKDVAKRKAYGQSVIDTVRAQAQRLQARVGKNDQAKLDQYLTGVRELEVRIQTSVSQTCNPGAKPGAPNGNQQELVTQMLDITALAVQCDVTRVATFAYEYTVTEMSHPFATGTSDGYHIGITHCGSTNLCDTNGTGYEGLYVKVNRWLVSQYAYLIGKLKAMPEGSGSVLDNSFVYLTSEFGDGSLHSPDNIPQIIAGKGGGTVQTGRLLDRQGARNGDVLLAMMNKIGLSQSQLGVCSAPIAL